jgi:hypothetical protein
MSLMRSGSVEGRRFDKRRPELDEGLSAHRVTVTRPEPVEGRRFERR